LLVSETTNNAGPAHAGIGAPMSVAR
jgi:hypothetical protein